MAGPGPSGPGFGVGASVRGGPAYPARGTARSALCRLRRLGCRRTGVRSEQSVLAPACAGPVWVVRAVRGCRGRLGGCWCIRSGCVLVRRGGWRGGVGCRCWCPFGGTWSWRRRAPVRCGFGAGCAWMPWPAGRLLVYPIPVCARPAWGLAGWGRMPLLVSVRWQSVLAPACARPVLVLAGCARMPGPVRRLPVCPVATRARPAWVLAGRGQAQRLASVRRQPGCSILVWIRVVLLQSGSGGWCRFGGTGRAGSRRGSVRRGCWRGGVGCSGWRGFGGSRGARSWCRPGRRWCGGSDWCAGSADLGVLGPGVGRSGVGAGGVGSGAAAGVGSAAVGVLDPGVDPGGAGAAAATGAGSADRVCSVPIWVRPASLLVGRVREQRLASVRRQPGCSIPM